MNEFDNYNNMEGSEPEEKKPAKKGSFLKDLIKDIIIAVVIVLAITAVIKPTIVKEESMLDTLQENNYLFVNKLAYKFKDHPEQGDIIVFRSELPNEDASGTKLLIKRVIGVEGDVISFEGDQVYRNGEVLNEDYIYDEDPVFRNYPNGKSFTVGEDEIFAMGDHRSVSCDSRSESVGMVSEEAVVGKAFVRLYPFNEITTL